MRYLFGSFVAIVLFTVPWLAANYPAQVDHFASIIERAGIQAAAVILSHRPKTIADLQTRYDEAGSSRRRSTPRKVRILVVPGHEPGYGGAEFRSAKEREMTVELAHDLAEFLRNNSRYEVFVTRDNEAWTPEFDSYFKNTWDDIVAWHAAHKDEIAQLTRVGGFKQVPAEIEHNSAVPAVALRLYGINKWANENDIDIAIHVHFNDYTGHGRTSAGKYSGFAIYVPEKQFYNSTTTRALAENVFGRLKKYTPVSDLPGEKDGIVEDQELIAVGSLNTVDAASMLIEYGYIYEPQFADPQIRTLALKDLAFETYLGLQDFFDADSAAGETGSEHRYETLTLPHIWKDRMTDLDGATPDIFALQSALSEDGEYPPEGKSATDCPRTGKIGSCTKEALAAFQEKLGIQGEKGIAGPQTIKALNDMFGITSI